MPNSGSMREREAPFGESASEVSGVAELPLELPSSSGLSFPSESKTREPLSLSGLVGSQGGLRMACTRKQPRRQVA
jgi:hypothetical protein